MSFIRRYVVEGRVYLAEVESVRVGNTVRQRYVRYLGREGGSAKASILTTSKPIAKASILTTSKPIAKASILTTSKPIAKASILTTSKVTRWSRIKGWLKRKGR